MAKLKLQISRPDFLLLGAVLLLTLFGLLMIYDSSVVLAQRDFADRFYYVKNQILWASFGIFLLLVFLNLDYHKVAYVAPLALVFGIILLIIVLIPQITPEILGARRRFELGPLTIQPAELVKLLFVLYLSSKFAKSQTEKGEALRLLPFLFILGILIGLVVAEPDLGTAIILAATGIIVYFVSGGSIKYFLVLLPLFVILGFGLALISPYRAARLTTFFNPQVDPQGQSYHVNQILIALGNGGMFGRGLGQSRQKYEYLPEAPTDSIFAVIAEELGFVGALAFLSAFLFVIYRGFKIACSASDRLGFILAFGITSWITLQGLVNLAGMVLLLPLTGVPLPFVSYGGSALVTMMAGIGILLNISRQQVKVEG
jgi:cell division protein FtsW